MTTSRIAVFRLLLVVVSVAVALGLGEAAARFRVQGRPDVGLRRLHVLRADRPWLYGLRPGADVRFGWGRTVHYVINQDGFRGPRPARPKPPDRFRVVILGDSIAFGYGVEETETFARQLESELNRRIPEAGIEILNLGVGGYNAWNEAKLLEDVGVAYQPDLVLVQFCINDLNSPASQFDGQTRMVLSAIPDDAFPDPSRRNEVRPVPSRSAAWCAHSMLCMLGRELWRKWVHPDVDDAAGSTEFEPVESEGGPEWRWLERNYLEMEAVARNSRARFAVLLIPYPGQMAKRQADPVREQFVSLGHRHGWTVVDPVPAFRAAHEISTQLFIDQWHPTPEGHRIIAKEALQVLTCAGQLGAEARRACPDRSVR